MAAGFFRTLSQRFIRSGPSNAKTKNNFMPDFTNAINEGPSSSAEVPKFDARKECQCKVLLLDNTTMNIIISKKAIGQAIYDQVFAALDLEERDYFGLQFTDHYHVQHWLDPLKKVRKQVPIGPPYTFRFRVKFYSSEPNNLREELTRYQFFLQLKNDIQTGKLDCTRDVAIELAALSLQSEFGDFNPSEHTELFISEFRFHPAQDEQMELAILEHYKSKCCAGLSPDLAELAYLNKAKWLELYGVDMHTVEGRDGNEYNLGLTPTGMLVFDGQQKIGLFFWEKIQRLDFRNRKLTLVVEEDLDQSGQGQIQLHTFVFELSSHKACKHLWKCAIEHHTFFRLKFHRPPRQRGVQLFRLGSTFKYRGRTEYENVHREELNLTQSSSSRGGASTRFERRSSQRFAPRQSHLHRQQRARQQEMNRDVQRDVAPLATTFSAATPVADPSVLKESLSTSASTGAIKNSMNSNMSQQPTTTFGENFIAQTPRKASGDVPAQSMSQPKIASGINSPPPITTSIDGKISTSVYDTPNHAKNTTTDLPESNILRKTSPPSQQAIPVTRIPSQPTLLKAPSTSSQIPKLTSASSQVTAHPQKNLDQFVTTIKINNGEEKTVANSANALPTAMKTSPLATGCSSTVIGNGTKIPKYVVTNSTLDTRNHAPIQNGTSFNSTSSNSNSNLPLPITKVPKAQELQYFGKTSSAKISQPFPTSFPTVEEGRIRNGKLGPDHLRNAQEAQCITNVIPEVSPPIQPFNALAQKTTLIPVIRTGRPHNAGLVGQPKQNNKFGYN